MSSRKLKIDNSTTIEIPSDGEHVFTETGNIVRKGEFDEKTGVKYDLDGETILFAGSKSSLKRLNLLERNIVVLARKQNRIESKLDKILNMLEEKND